MYDLNDPVALELFEIPEWESVETASELELCHECGIKEYEPGELTKMLSLETTVNPDTLQKQFKMTKKNARALAATIELLRRARPDFSNKRISYPSDSLPYFQYLAYKHQEHFACLTLNGAHEVIDIHTITVGLINRTVVHPREVFRPAIMDNAAAVIVAHNHPSGNQNPSADDKDVVTRLVAAGKQIGITVLDHLVVVKHGYYSFLEHGDM